MDKITRNIFLTYALYLSSPATGGVGVFIGMMIALSQDEGLPSPHEEHVRSQLRLFKWLLILLAIDFVFFFVCAVSKVDTVFSIEVIFLPLIAFVLTYGWFILASIWGIIKYRKSTLMDKLLIDREMDND